MTVGALRRAVEGRDAEALAAMYADNAVMLVIDQDNPPSNPRRLAGKAAISSYFSDVCGRDIAHLIEKAIAAGDRLAFTQSCTYADGTKVFCAAMLDLKAENRAAHRHSGLGRLVRVLRQTAFGINRLPGTCLEPSPGTKPRAAGSSFRRQEDLKQVPGEKKMKVPGKLSTAVLAVTLMAATVPLSTSAEAAWRGGGWGGGGWGWGGFGVGLAAGALIGGALAAPYYGGYYAYDPGYYGGYGYGGGYYAPAYYAYAPGPAYYGGSWGGGPYWWHRRHWRHWHNW